MACKKTRSLIVVWSVAAVVLALPAQSKACSFFDCLFGGGSQAASPAPVAPQTYAPVYAPQAAPQCSSCAPQTCQYVPQTCYRTVSQYVPVTAYRPIVSRDPCSGCQVTSYSPVTSWTRQTRLVPYTTYRVVYGSVCSSCQAPSACSSCGSAATGSGCSSCQAGATGSGCSSCQAGATNSLAVPYSSPTPAPTTGAAPALNNSTPPKTFEQESKKVVEPPLDPIPLPGTQPITQPSTTLNSTTVPRLIDPENRTTWRMVRPISYNATATPQQRPIPAYRAPVDDGGWRASRD